MELDDKIWKNLELFFRPGENPGKTKMEGMLSVVCGRLAWKSAFPDSCMRESCRKRLNSWVNSGDFRKMILILLESGMSMSVTEKAGGDFRMSAARSLAEREVREAGRLHEERLLKKLVPNWTSLGFFLENLGELEWLELRHACMWPARSWEFGEVSRQDMADILSLVADGESWEKREMPEERKAFCARLLNFWIEKDTFEEIVLWITRKGFRLKLSAAGNPFPAYCARWQAWRIAGEVLSVCESYRSGDKKSLWEKMRDQFNMLFNHSTEKTLRRHYEQGNEPGQGKLRNHAGIFQPGASR